MTEYVQMTPAEFRAGLQSLAITQKAFAEMLGLNHRTVKVWALGEGAIPSYAAVILRLLVAGIIDAEDIEQVMSTPLTSGS